MGLRDTLSDAKEQAGERASVARESVSEKTTDAKQSAAQKTTNARSRATEGISTARESATEAAGAVKSSTAETAGQVKETASERTTTAREAAPERATSAKKSTAEKTATARETASDRTNSAYESVSNAGRKAGPAARKYGKSAGAVVKRIDLKDTYEYGKYGFVYGGKYGHYVPVVGSALPYAGLVAGVGLGVLDGTDVITADTVLKVSESAADAADTVSESDEEGLAQTAKVGGAAFADSHFGDSDSEGFSDLMDMGYDDFKQL